ncbi:hypothetical protein Tco_0313114 [Tanacetum coccineum]
MIWMKVDHTRILAICLLKMFPDEEKVISVGHFIDAACISYAIERFSNKVAKTICAALQRILDAQQACREDNTNLLMQRSARKDMCCPPKEWSRRTTMHFCQAVLSRDRQDPPNPELTACIRAESAPVCFLSCPSSLFSFLLLFHYPPFESFAMSLEESDDLNIPDAAPVDPALEARTLPKFYMHLYKSSLNEGHVRYLVKLYSIPGDLHLRVVPEGMTMNALPPGAIGLYAHHFQQGGLRHHDSSVADPFPRPSEYNASDVAKLREVVISLSRPPLSIFSSPTGAARVTHLAPPAEQLEDVPPKTCDMVVAEIPCRKVLDDKEKKKRKAEEKAKAKAPVVNIQAEAVVNKGVGREGPCKKRRVRAEAQAHPDSEHVSSPTPLNHAKPLEALLK